MTADAAEIVRLAERVEALAGNARDTDLEWEIHFACRSTLPEPLAYTASLDAAAMLVPEGWRWTAGHREFPHARGYVENGELAFVGVGTRRNPNRLWFETTATTPALALTAAALRARAAQHDHEVG